MAKKRMFRLDVLETDAFMEMPLSTQALYFHLCLRADDDGFVGNPKMITRNIGATVDDLNVLIAKRFLLTFDDGVIVIKHWRMHNSLSRDRYHETNYVECKSKLLLKENGAYSFAEGEKIDDTKLLEKSNRQSIDASKTQLRRNIDAAKTHSDIDIGLGLDKGLDIERDKEREKPPKRFTPPTTEEVKAYCEERGNNVDPERFIDFYASKGWKVGNQGMKDWKAAVRTWEKRDTQSKDTTARAIEAFLAEG